MWLEESLGKITYLDKRGHMQILELFNECFSNKKCPKLKCSFLSLEVFK